MPIYEKKQNENINHKNIEGLATKNNIDTLDTHDDVRPDNGIISVLRHRYDNDISMLGEKTYHLSVPKPYKKLQEITADFQANSTSAPVFIMIDMQKLRNTPRGLRFFLTKKTI